MLSFCPPAREAWARAQKREEHTDANGPFDDWPAGETLQRTAEKTNAEEEEAALELYWEDAFLF